jgi:capsular exopolysaccharide synthesis family protein
MQEPTPFSLRLPSLPSQPMPPLMNNESENGASSISASQLIAGIRRHLWIPFSLALFGLVLGYSYYKKQKPVYEATSVAEFGNDQSSITGMDSLGGSNLRDEKAINTLIQQAKSHEVMRRVVAELDLTKYPAFTGGHAMNSTEAKESAMRMVSSMIRISLRKETRLIDFSASGSDPELVSSLSSQAMLSLVAELEDQKSKAIQGAVQTLVAEGQRLQEKLKKSEIAMLEYKRSNDAISLDERKDLVLSKFKELGTDLNRQANERLILETHLQACQSGDLSSDQLLILPTVANHPKVSGILSQIGAQKASLAVLAERYKPKHPKFQSAAAVIANLEEQLKSLLADAVGLLKSSCENAREVERKLDEQLKKQESEVMNLEQLAVQYNVLKREMGSDQAVYESVLSRIKQVDVSKGMATPSIWIQQLAMVPNEPTSLNAPKVFGTSAAGGFMLGLVIIGLLVKRDNSIRTVEDAREKLRHPILGTITNIRPSALEASGEANASPLKSILLAHKRVVEQMREFRIVAGRMTRNQKAFYMIVSAVPEEGKTFVSTHFSVSLASQGLRTLLIDMDLRRPSLAKTFGLPTECLGVTDLLSDKASLKDVCIASGIDNLTVITAGQRVSTPAELLATCGIERLRAMAFDAGFDRVVIDTAPIIPISDSLVLGQLVDHVFMVVRCNRTPSFVAQDAIQKLNQGGIALSGIILNRQTQRSSGYYYNKYYSYYESPKEVIK